MRFELVQTDTYLAVEDFDESTQDVQKGKFSDLVFYLDKKSNPQLEYDKELRMNLSSSTASNRYLNRSKMIYKNTFKHLEDNPKKHSGKPVFRDTRIPVYYLLEYLEYGDSIDEFLDSYDFSEEGAHHVRGFLEELRKSFEKK